MNRHTRVARLRVPLVATAALLLFAFGASAPLAAPSYTDWSAPVNLGPAINTSNSEGGPALTDDDQATLQRHRLRLERLLAPGMPSAGEGATAAMSDADLVNALSQYLDFLNVRPRIAGGEILRLQAHRYRASGGIG